MTQGPVHPTYPRIFSPISLGPVEVPNRFYLAPHALPLAIGTAPSDDYVRYNVERVRGGCGLVVSSLTVHERALAHQQPSPFPEANVGAFRATADAVHEAGAKIVGQLWYWWGVQAHWQPQSPPAPPLAPSALPYEYGGVSRSTHEMDADEIDAMVDAFRVSAAHLREADYDGVMLHMSHGALLQQFASPYFNRRTDQYGGSLDNRLRLPFRVMEAARASLGDDRALGIRLNCDEMLPNGLDKDATREVLARLCSSGLLDFVDLDIAVEPMQLYLGMPSVFIEPQVYRPYVEAVRDATLGLPVLSVLGRLTSVAEGEAALEAGACDMVGAARALIAEPELVKNAYEGNEDRSRTCIACNWCVGAPSHGAAGCAINPASYRERFWGAGTFTSASRQAKVIIVGGGPGGLEAARVSALRGHDVTLLEARAELGGGLALWASLPGREWYQKGIDWWQRELGRLDVRVLRNHEATAAAVLAESPDAVIVATGSRYDVHGRSGFRDAVIPGYDQAFVYRPEEILLHGARPTGHIALLDGEGHQASAGLAEMLALAGNQVEYISPGFVPLSINHMARHDFEPMIERMKRAGVQFLPTTYVRAIGQHRLTVYDVFTDEERTVDSVDAVVLVTSRLPVDGLSRELKSHVAQLYTIGDALAARSFGTAAYEGQKFARMIGEPAAPPTVGATFFSRDPAEFARQVAVPRTGMAQAGRGSVGDPS